MAADHAEMLVSIEVEHQLELTKKTAEHAQDLQELHQNEDHRWGAMRDMLADRRARCRRSWAR